MNLINKDKLIEGIKDKKFCKYCHYVGNNNKCFYPSDMSCSPAAMISSIIQYIEELDSADWDSMPRFYTKMGNDKLNENYVAVLEKALSDSIKKSPEEAKEELIRMGVLNEDGTPKEQIVDNE